jgi:hypothetical protein
MNTALPSDALEGIDAIPVDEVMDGERANPVEPERGSQILDQATSTRRRNTPSRFKRSGYAAQARSSENHRGTILSRVAMLPIASGVEL